MSRQAFIEPLLGPLLKALLAEARPAEMPRASPGRATQGVDASAPGPQWWRDADLWPLGVTAFPHVGCPYPSQVLGVPEGLQV